jgi:hypothetical protein
MERGGIKWGGVGRMGIKMGCDDRADNLQLLRGQLGANAFMRQCIVQMIQ